MKRLVLIIHFLFVILTVFSQVHPLKDSSYVVKKIGFIQLTKNPYKDSVRFNKKVKVVPAIFASYSPELKFMIGTGGLVSYKNNPLDSLAKTSVFPFNFLFSTSNSYLFKGMFSTYFYNDRMRILGELTFKNMNDNYWGVGYESGERLIDADSSTFYRTKWALFNPSVLFKVWDSFYAGFKINISTTKVQDGSNFFYDDINVQKYGTNIANVGVGLVLSYDTRDNPENAKKGVYLGSIYEQFSSIFGSDYSYSVLTLDYRQYKKPFFETGIIAWQLKSRLCFGDTPWTDLSKLGSENGLRGYHSSRFRDAFMALAQVEYRYMFPVKRNYQRNIFNRHGFVLWLGGGTIASSVGEISAFLPNAGVGYRLELLKNINARFDIGFAEKNSLFYFTINESF